MKYEVILESQKVGFVSTVIGKSVESFSDKPFYYLWLREAEKWLYDKYTIIINVCPHYKYKTFGVEVYDVNNNADGYTPIGDSERFDNPQDALEYAVLESLLLIVKTYEIEFWVNTEDGYDNKYETVEAPNEQVALALVASNNRKGKKFKVHKILA